MKKQQITLSRKKAMRKVVWMKAAFLLLMFVIALHGRAQNTDSKLISLELKEAPLGEALKQFSNVSGYKVNFPSEDVRAYRVSVSIHQLAPLAALQKILEGKPFEYEVKQHFITVRKVKPASPTRKVRNIEGRVVDEKGDPLPGANIRGIGSPFGAISDIKGNFTCKVMEETHTLEVSFVGMQTEKVSIKGRTHVNVVMHEDKQQLGDVVVTGYQRISRERSTASFGFIDSEQLTRQMHSDLASSLEGQIAGLRMNINPNNGDMSPILRGVGTFSPNVGTMPLIVVDDMPTDLTLSEINPYNVESITVLKDAAAASIYGALAANGVIVVTTKQAKKEGANVSINADWFITTKPNFKSLNLASTSEIIDYQTAVFDANVAEIGSASGYLSGFKSGYYNPLFQLYLDRENGDVSSDEVNATLNQWRNNDYYKEYRDNAWRTAVTQRYNVSVSQKAGNNNHYLSFNYETDNQRIISSKSNRISLYYKSNYAITSWMNVNAGVDVRMGRSDTPNTSYTGYAIQQRYERILDADGNRYTSPYVNVGNVSYNGSVVGGAEGVAPYKSFGFNVLDVLDESKTKSHDVSIRPFVSLQARFLKMFKYNFMYQYEWNKSKNEQFDSEDSYAIRMLHNSMVDTDRKAHLPQGGRYSQSEVESKRYTVRNQIDFDNSWKDHRVTAIAGLEFRENKIPKSTSQLFYGYDPQTLTSDQMNWQEFRDGVGTSALSGSRITLSGLPGTLKETRHRYASFYANAAYSFLSRYHLSGSIRWDQADLFGLDIRKQRHPLWSVGASWILSEESFMKEISWLDYLKARMTYGINGNVDQSSTTYFIVKQKTQSNPIKTTYLTYEDDDLPNPKLRWEKTATYNIGLDFRLFNNVISGSLEYYNRQSSDLLVRRYMDPTMGAKSRKVNNGEMRNRGVELSLTANIVRKKDWNFAVDFNFDYNKNKMLKVDHSDADNVSSFIKSPQDYFMEGTSYNTLWAYRIDRIENGYPVAVDKDGNDLVKFNEDGTVASITSNSSLKGTDDLVNLGSLTPKFSGSLAFRLNYKNFDLNAFFVYAGGNKLRNSVVSMSDQIGSQTLKGISNRWSADEPDAQVRMYHDMPSQVKTYAGIFEDWWKYGDINVKDAGYVKLRSLSLGYNLPLTICQHLRLNSLKVKVQVNNLFTWCKAGNDIDPESYNMNGGTRGMASPKTYSIGLSTSF